MRNPDGQRSNLLPLLIGDEPATPMPGPSATPAATATPSTVTATPTRGRVTATPTVGRVTRTPTPGATRPVLRRRVFLPLGLRGVGVPGGQVMPPVARFLAP